MNRVPESAAAEHEHSSASEAKEEPYVHIARAECSEAQSGEGQVQKEGPRGKFQPSAPSRRGGESLRTRTLEAFDNLQFPPLATDAVSQEMEFSLPKGFIDNDAPIGARKW